MIHAIRRLFSEFLHDEGGNVLILIGLAAFTMMTAVGTSIDMARAQMLQSKISTALDAAGLAAGVTANTINVQTQASKYFNANFPPNYLGSATPTVTATPTGLNSATIDLIATTTQSTTLMKIVGINNVSVGANSQITRQSTGMELVLVLDNTGSMNSPVNPANSNTPKISALKTAATTLLGILYGGNATVPNLWVGVVPFSQAVNVSTGYPTWMDATYNATLDFGANINGTSCQSYTGNSLAKLQGGEDFAGTQATGVLTFASNPTNNKTIVLNGVTWTFVTGTASGNQTKIGANLASTMTALETSLNASNNNSIKVATYYATTTALNITYDTVGAVGNAYTLGIGTSPVTITNPTSAGSYSSTPSCTYTLNGYNAATTFTQMNNWGGCVMARTAPYDISDDTPATVPFQAYNYPPTPNASINYNPWIKVQTTGHGSSPTTYTATTTYNYSFQSSLPGYYGPNLFCPKPMLPMVADQSIVLNSINALSAGGSTIIDLGMAWAYRMLSPKWRGLWGGQMNTNNLPLNYNSQLMQKVVILMTDGMNSLTAGNFTAYDYLNKGVLGTTNTTTANSVLDTRTLNVCTALKNNGVIIYTIGFGTNGNNDPSDPTSVNGALLQSCATQPSYYFLAPTNTQLTAAFQAIGQSLANLRISQ